MITVETLEKLARHHRISLFPNIVREYFQHVFLEQLYRLDEAERMLFKGGTALRVIYGSPRFSEDLDFSLFGVSPAHIKSFVEGLFVRALAEAERAALEASAAELRRETAGLQERLIRSRESVDIQLAERENGLRELLQRNQQLEDRLTAQGHQVQESLREATAYLEEKVRQIQDEANLSRGNLNELIQALGRSQEKPR